MDPNRIRCGTGKCVRSSSVHRIYRQNLQADKEQSICIYGWLHIQTVVRKPAERPAVAAFSNRDIARIWEWCNLWCMILNPNKTKAVVVSRSRTVNAPRGDLVLSGVSFALVPNSTSLAWSLTANSPSNTMCVLVSQRIGNFRLVKRVFVDTYVLLRCYFAFLLPILEHCSPLWGQLLNGIFSFLSARYIP